MAGEHDLSGPLSGTRLLDSAAALREALESGSWVMGAMAGVGLAADTVATVADPLGEAIAAGVGWAIDHLGSLKEWLQELTGNPGQVSAASETWGNVASHLEECAGMITTSITSRLGTQHSKAVDAYKELQRGFAEHLSMVAGLVKAVGAGLKLASFLVNMVYEMVRDAISEILGKVIAKAAISVVTLGTAAPAMVASLVADVTQWVTRLSREITDLVTSCRNLDDLLRQVRTIFDELKDALKAIKGIADTNVTSAAVAAAASRRRPPHTPRHAAPPKPHGGGAGGGKSGDDGGKGGGDPLSGPVVFRPPPNSTAGEVAEARRYVQGCNEALEAGALSPTGRVSTRGKLSSQAQDAAKAERAAHPELYPPGTVVGHVPDSTWVGRPDPYKYMPLSRRVNSSLAGQNNRYPVGYKPTEFLLDEGEGTP